jgi:hypothetical protein
MMWGINLRTLIVAVIAVAVVDCVLYATSRRYRK